MSTTTTTFDKVWHTGLVYKLINAGGIPLKFVAWIKSFLTNQQNRVLFEDALSRSRHFKAGVPQGSVLSPFLYNIYTSDMPDSLKADDTGAYADDVGRWHTENNNIIAAASVQTALNDISQWSRDWKLTINPSKSEVIHFTPDTREFKYKPNITIDDNNITPANSVKYLGVTFDRMLTFNRQTDDVVDRAKSRCRALRALACGGWGATRADLRQLYKAFVLPVITYCLGAWGAHLSDTSIKKLESCLLQGGRAITGLYRSTPTDFVRQEARLDSFRTLRDRAVATCYSKSLHLPTNNPRRIIMEKYQPNRLESKHSCRSMGQKLFHKAPLNRIKKRSQLSVYPVEPWNQPNLSVHTQLTDQRATQPTQDEPRLAAVRAIMRHGPQTLTYYTDGSVDGGVINGGCGVIQTEGDPAAPSVIAAHSSPGPAMCSSYDVECIARINLRRT